MTVLYKINYLFVFTFLFLFSSKNVFSQCEISVSAVLQGSNQQTLVCGDSATLIVNNAFGVGAVVFEENFNTGAPTGWQSTSQATYTNPCSPGGVDGTTHLWMGSAAAVPRIMTTIPFNLSTAIAGATVCFDMLFATQGNAAPCEGPDEPNEGVFLQYSTNNGATWIDIHYFNPNGGNDPQLVNWNNWCFALPADAISPNTQIRWAQTSDSGADYDHWGLDNVQIFFNDPNYTITWLHDGYTYPYASTGGANPTGVFPATTTTYTAEISNGTNTCTASVTVNVVLPTAAVSVAQDTAICPGECVTLNGDARIIKRPAKTPTYSNNNLTPVANAFGSTTTSTITISDLNMEDVLPGSITSICINSATFFGAGITPTFPPSFVQQNLGDLIVRVYCPDGTSIVLVPAGQTTSANPLQGYTNTCFVPAGGANIGAGTPPYTSNYAPNQPFDNLAGCTANGDWVMELQTNSALGFGSGFFGGWRITFDDPEISYEGDFTWSPTTNMTSSNTLTPTVCPTSQTTYTISVVDTAGCIPPSVASATISIDPSCCPINFDATVTQPSCAVNNGSISVIVLNGSGNYQYTWSGNATGNTNTLTNLGGGTYTLSVFDIDLDCTRDTTITLVTPNAPTITSTTTTDANCGTASGSITINATGGTPPYTYSVDGINFVSSNTISSLTNGTYTVTVRDNLNCEVTETVEVPNSGVEISNVDITNPSCGLNNGEISVSIIRGNALIYNYRINGGSLQSDSVFTNLSSGTYLVQVQDGFGCSDTLTVELIEEPNFDINFSLTNPTCNNADGEISVTVNNGVGPFEYAWSNGGNTNTNSNLVAGTYVLTISDLGVTPNCIFDTTFVLNDADGPQISSITATAETCLGDNDGTVTVVATGGTGALTYTWTPGNLDGATQTNLSSGQYTVVVEDENNCSATDVVEVVAGANCCNISVTAAIVNSSCGNDDGSITLTVVNGTGNYSYSWASGTNELTGIANGTYNVVITDVNAPALCQIDTFFVVNDANGPVVAVSNIVNPTCAGNDGSLDIGLAGGTAPYSVTFESGGVSETVSVPFPISVPVPNLPAGTVNITVEDALGCTTTETVTLTAPTNCCTLEITSVSAQNETCDEANGSIVVVANETTPNITYTWNGGETGSTLSNLSAGSYTVTVSNTDVVGCSVSETIILTNTPSPIIENIFITDETCLGLNDGIAQAVVVDGEEPYIYTWNAQVGQEVQNNLSAGTNTLTVEDANGCSETQTFEILSGANSTVFAGNDTSINVGESLQLEAEITGAQGGVFNWSPSVEISCTDCFNPIVTPSSNAVYTVSYTDPNGCNALDNISIVVNPDNPFCLFPDAFTPNGDNVNDFFRTICEGAVFVELKIYNRWGELVYQEIANNSNINGWNGVYKGRNAPLDVYVYYAFIEYVDGKTESRMGNVTLIR